MTNFHFTTPLRTTKLCGIVRPQAADWTWNVGVPRRLTIALLLSYQIRGG